VARRWARRWRRLAALLLSGLTVLTGGWVGISPLLAVHQPGVPILNAAGQPTGEYERALPLEALDFITILIVGLDGSVRHVDLPPSRTPGFAEIPLADVRGRADAVMLLGLDRRTGRVRLLHIPRDSIVNLPGRGEDKITHVMAYFSIYEMKRTVENLLRIPVHRFVLVDFEGFQRLVDAIGGVTVTLDHDLRGPTGVWLPKGTHRLDGALALRLVRHRYGESSGDIARIRLQYTFLVGLARELLTGGFSKALGAYAASPDALKTNIALLEAVPLWREWQGYDPEAVEHLYLPGRPEAHYWRLDPAGILRTASEFWPDLPETPAPGSPETESPGATPPEAAWPDRPTLAGGLLLEPFIHLAGLDRDRLWAQACFGYLHPGCASSLRPQPTVVIYHTHTCESFLPELIPNEEDRLGRDRGREAFSANPELNVVRVGRELAEALSALGFDVRHITTIHDPGGPDGRRGAYERSRRTVAEVLAGIRNPVLVIDLHRNSVTARAELGGHSAAAVLFVVGRHNPWWQWNYTVARNLEGRISTAAPGLSRGMCLLEGRYNEDLSPLALLVEVGGADSTLEECLFSARIVAGVLADYFQGR